MSSSVLNPSVTSSASPSASSSNSNSGNTAPASFYKNLFYILIGLLCAFGLVSFFSLMRARRRRTAIFREANRLGVLVPGLPGYIPLRDRAMMRWTKADGTETPEWWEVGQDEKSPPSSTSPPAEDIVATVDGQNFNPLGVIPPVEPYVRPAPPPASTLPYFPNHLAYKAESLLPPPSRFKADNPDSLEGLDGEHVEVLTIIQMPKENWPEGREVPEEEEVMKEWAGIELGSMKIDVSSSRRR